MLIYQRAPIASKGGHKRQKNMLDRAGLNPINKNQTQTAKYVSIESRFSRDALERFEKEETNKAGE